MQNICTKKFPYWIPKRKKKHQLNQQTNNHDQEREREKKSTTAHPKSWSIPFPQCGTRVDSLGLLAVASSGIQSLSSTSNSSISNGILFSHPSHRIPLRLRFYFYGFMYMILVEFISRFLWEIPPATTVFRRCLAAPILAVTPAAKI